MFLHISEVCQAVGSFSSSAVWLYAKRHGGTGRSSVVHWYWSYQFVLPLPFVSLGFTLYNYLPLSGLFLQKDELSNPPQPPNKVDAGLTSYAILFPELHILLIFLCIWNTPVLADQCSCSSCSLKGNQRLSKGRGSVYYLVDVSQHLDYWLREVGVGSEAEKSSQMSTCWRWDRL